MLRTQDLMARLMELDPGGEMRVVVSEHEIPGADGSYPENPGPVVRRYARPGFGPDAMDWCGAEDEGAFPVVVLQGAWDE